MNARTLAARVRALPRLDDPRTGHRNRAQRCAWTRVQALEDALCELAAAMVAAEAAPRHGPVDARMRAALAADLVAAEDAAILAARRRVLATDYR